LYTGQTTIKQTLLDYSIYYERVNAEFTMKAKMIAYRRWLHEHDVSVKVREITYNDPREFVFTFEKQFAFYYEVMYELKKNNPGVKVFIPCDGVGAMSYVCNILGIDYFSTEPMPIGDVARELMLISSISRRFTVMNDRVTVLCNLNSYFDYSLYVDSPFIIIDEDRLFSGVPVKYCKHSTYGRLYTNVISHDNFKTMNKDYNKSVKMLENLDCVPLDSKSEYALIRQEKKVFTDGFVMTITPSEVKEEGLTYIVSSNEPKLVGKHEIEIDYVPKYMDRKPSSFTFRIVGYVHGVSYRKFIRKVCHNNGVFCDVRNNWVEINDRKVECVEGMINCDEEKGRQILEDIVEGSPPKAKIIRSDIDIKWDNAKVSVQIKEIEKLYGLNITNRGDPNNLHGTLVGHTKQYCGELFVASGIPQNVSTPNSFETIEVPLYNSSQELRNWYSVHGNYVAQCLRPRNIRYLMRDEIKVYLVYMHSFKKGDKIFCVFRDSKFCQLLTQDQIT